MSGRDDLPFAGPKTMFACEIYDETLNGGSWWWPLYGQLLPETVDEAIQRFDALDAEPWCSAPRRVVQIDHAERVVWTA
jgi:hypothetical protein